MRAKTIKERLNEAIIILDEFDELMTAHYPDETLWVQKELFDKLTTFLDEEHHQTMQNNE